MLRLIQPRRLTALAAALALSASIFAGLAQPALANDPGHAASLAASQVGTAYRFGAESPSAGFDSSGLAWWAFKQQGISLPRTVAAQSRIGEAVDKADLQPGDMVFFATAGSGSAPTRVGIYLGDGRFVSSAQATSGVAARSLSTEFYARTYWGARRVSTSNGGSSGPGQPPDLQPGDPPSSSSGDPGSSQGDTSAQIAQDLIAYGKKFLGTPYKFGAEYETSGKFDCSSFTQYVFKKFGYKLPRTARTQVKLGKYVPKSELKPGDLVFFKALGRPIGDVGIYIGNNQILQAFPPRVRITNLTWSWWKKNYVTARRIIGVEPRSGR